MNHNLPLPPSTPPEPDKNDFSQLGISSRIRAALDTLKISVPTPIQRQAIPAGLAGKDIMGIAQTGTGKTLAFGIPLIERLDHIPGRALVLLPTRELAGQAAEALAHIGRPFQLRATVLIGGESMHRQIQELRRNPRIIVATPGRLIDHLEQRTVRLNDVKILVLDEADRMLDMGFAPQLQRILVTVPRERQTLLFSATMPQAIVKMATAHMKLPLRVEVAPAGTAAADVEQEIIVVRQDAKLTLLMRLLEETDGTALVFTRTKRGAAKVTRILRSLGQAAAEIHADRSQSQRREALAGFKSGRYRVLVATDIAARGIDVQGIAVVVNFDLPDNAEDYVHRIGRTGRAGRKGRAVSFAAPDQRGEIRVIERLIRKSLKVSQFAADGKPLIQDKSGSSHEPRRGYGDRKRSFGNDQRPPRNRSFRDRGHGPRRK